ncbi:outer membrane usher protein PefC [Salmonella enterica subsp. enterica serovar Kandla]|nr:outer membrane usher protein PefC [Salmonella enterica subsp. enterica serovar Kandla]EBX9805259.1 outer membrane usher protein PefC [Salmonella enterica subsp. enterica serovar Kandla]EBY1906911.1 outer membrane usher protein PefC [Salmonella enterica subsp. enterica serovar Kandla]ECD3788068.1 outer membrane usher protein PefC [Salmonella enterica subsp. enterica serovar Kandla]
MNKKIAPALSLITLSIYASFGHATETELNTAFLQGTTGVPSVLKDGVVYPAGHYYVDVSLNGNKTGRTPLSVSLEEELAGQLCLSPEWLKKSGVFFKTDVYQDTFDKERNCYTPGKKESTKVDFDLSNQTLSFSIPQAWLTDKSDVTRWDYGINGLRLTYTGNFNKNIQTANNSYSNDSLNAYGSFNASLNLGRWVLSGDMNASRSHYGSEFETNNLLLSTAISQVRGDLEIGRSQTRTELFQDFGFYGIALRSNSNMRPWSARGYAPVVTGVASSTSRITVSQGGYTIYSRVVPAGPYHIDDISPVSNGTLIVTVEDNSGKKTVTEYPVATLPTLLRPGEFSYNFALGERNSSNKVDEAFRSGLGGFALASVDYGFSTTTFNSALLLHENYQAVGIGMTQSLGNFGAFSTSLNASKAEYDYEDTRKGVSATFKYAKSFTSRTDLQLLTYRYQSPGYTEFSSWQPDEKLHYRGSWDNYRYAYFRNKEKARYEARLSHRFDRMYLSGSYWQQTYWDHDTDARGATISASAYTDNGINFYLNGNYSSSAWSSRDEYSASFGVSIPFTLGGVNHYSNSSVGYNRNGNTSFNTNVSATVNDRLNYNVNAGADNRDNRSVGATVSYAFDRIQTNTGISKSQDITTLSGNVSGSVIATKKTGLILTKEVGNTVAVVRIKDMPGITFNNSLPTNDSGSTVLYLTGYSPTTINIDPENVPDTAELLHTSFDVVPTDKAIVYREFGFEQVLRYILRLYDSDGNIITGGYAVTEQNLNAGFISNNGVLLMNLLAKPQTITVTQDNGKKCSFSGNGLKENTGKVQEIRCE